MCKLLALKSIIFIPIQQFSNKIVTFPNKQHKTDNEKSR